MKIQHQLWLIYSIIFILISTTVFIMISSRYENHLQMGSEQVALTQGFTMLERFKDTYPYEPNRSMGYLRIFSQQFDNRLIMFDQDKKVYADSFAELEPQTALDLTIFKSGDSHNALTEFYYTEEYGYVQYTLIPFTTEQQYEGYLLIVSEANQLYDEIKSFQFWVIQIMFVAIGAFFIVSYFVSNWLSAPIRKIILNLKEITPQKRTFRMRYKRRDEIKELIEALEEMSEKLNLYDERQKRFLSTSSHELKTPLATIYLILENLPYVRENEEMFSEYVQDLFFQVKKMKQMVDQLLQMNEMLDLGFEKEMVNAQEIKKQLNQSFQYIAKDKNINLEFDLEPVELYVNRALFQQGLDNIVSNAIRYSSSNHTVKISIKNEKDEIRISTCDQGIGISAEDVEHIFEPFYRSNDATAWNQEGSGLGLYMVKQMVEMHNGRIEVKTEQGKGTRIDLFFQKP